VTNDAHQPRNTGWTNATWLSSFDLVNENLIRLTPKGNFAQVPELSQNERAAAQGEAGGRRTNI
jgi:hypothetical protein